MKVMYLQVSSQPWGGATIWHCTTGLWVVQCYVPAVHVKQVNETIYHILALAISSLGLLHVFHVLRMALLDHSIRFALNEQIAQCRGGSAGGVWPDVLLLRLDQREVRNGRRVRHGLSRRPWRGELVHGE